MGIYTQVWVKHYMPYSFWFSWGPNGRPDFTDAETPAQGLSLSLARHCSAGLWAWALREQDMLSARGCRGRFSPPVGFSQLCRLPGSRGGRISEPASSFLPSGSCYSPNALVHTHPRTFSSTVHTTFMSNLTVSIPFFHPLCDLSLLSARRARLVLFLPPIDKMETVQEVVWLTSNTGVAALLAKASILYRLDEKLMCSEGSLMHHPDNFWMSLNWSPTSFLPVTAVSCPEPATFLLSPSAQPPDHLDHLPVPSSQKAPGTRYYPRNEWTPPFSPSCKTILGYLPKS